MVSFKKSLMNICNFEANNMNRQYSIYGSRSLTKDFSIGFLIIILFISVLVFSSSALMFLKIEESKFQDKIHDIFQDFKDLIATPLWHYDDEEVTSICKTFLSGGAVSKIVIISSDDKSVYSFGNVEEKESEMAVFSDTLLYKTRQIGKVEFYPKKPKYFEQNKFYFYTIVSAISIICLFIIIATWFLLRVYVNRPLGKLIDWIKQIEKGEYKKDDIYFPQNEIQTVVNHFSLMVDSIKNREKRIRDSEERFRDLSELLPEAIYEMDTKGKLIFANQRAFDQFMYTQNDFEEGINLFDMIIPKDRQRAKENGEKILNGEEIGLSEYTALRKDGSTFPIMLHASPIFVKGIATGLRGIVIDVSERIMSEMALKESEFKFRSLFDLSPQAIALTAVGTGKLIDVNDKFCELTKYSKEELLELTTKEVGFYSDDDRNRFIKEIKVSGEVQGLKMDFKAKDGSTLNTLMFAKIIQIAGKNYILTIFLDVTDKKRLEARLAQAYKMEAIGTLAGGIAHDFNNILSPIILYTEMLLQDTSTENPLRFNLEEILSASMRAKDLTKQILTFSRQTEQERVPLLINPIIKEALKLLRSSLPSTIKIRQNIEAKVGVVLGDPTQIHQILMNLCTNAAHSMRGKGGLLEVDLADVDLYAEDAARIGDLKPGQYIKLTVSDTGAGMESNTKERIFEPYFTTSRKGEGTGLGLSVVHGIVKSYEGTITVDSKPGVGTVFEVFLPKVEKHISSKPASTVHIPGGTERVMLIDDEPSILEALQQMLKRLGYKVSAIRSSIEALKAFRAAPDEFDLVITDYTMPEMTGADVAKAVMDIRPDISVILSTGFSEQIDERESKAIGIRAFVMKPIVVEEIAQTVRKVLDRNK
jgi:PAS domain S-box-containing protein